MYDGEIQIFATWFHNDRELARGGTPAARYAARPELPASERDAAARIADARLGLYRVLAVEPGRSLALEAVIGGSRIEVRSPHVSREAVRWDLLLARVMEGDPPSLWVRRGSSSRARSPSSAPSSRGSRARHSTTSTSKRSPRPFADTRSR
jgi:hypothetical protein